MTTQWVVVAESYRARFFERGAVHQSLHEIEDMVCPSARQSGQALLSDRAPRIFQSAGGHGHAVTPGEEPHDLEVEKFAKAIAKRLDAGRMQHKYEELYLAAAPALLGALRQHLNDQVAKLVVSSVNHNLVDRPENEIRQQFHLT